MMTECPSPETLGRLAEADSSVTAFRAVEAHVEHCVGCQAVLERLTANPSVTVKLGMAAYPLAEGPPAIPGFEVECELGRGGMGVVYQAWQPGLGRRVAIKVVSGGKAALPDERRRWLREAHALGQVRHPNVVRLHDAGESEGWLYLVLELVPGGSLAKRARGPLPARVAVELMVTIAETVDSIHRLGITHLDIKPSNVLLGGPPDAPWDQVNPLIADFGIAKLSEAVGGTNSVSIAPGGTPSYMAPEQVPGGRVAVGARTDVYALGATLYCLLTGRPPFQAATVIETLDLVRTKEAAPMRTLIPGLARDLETIVQKCLRKDPRQRYTSAQALADDLRRWLEGSKVQARPVSVLVHAARWSAQRPALASSLVLLGSTLTAGLVVFFSLWRYADGQRVLADRNARAASGAVGDLLGLVTTTVQEPERSSLDRLMQASQTVRRLTAKQREEGGLSPANRVAIAGLERQMAQDFRGRGHFDESRVLLQEGIDLLNASPRVPRDTSVEEAYALTWLELGRVELDQERPAEALVDFRRTEAALEGLVREAPTLGVIMDLDASKRLSAQALEKAGLGAERRALLEGHVRMLEGLPESVGHGPEIALLAALARAELDPDRGAHAAIVTATRCFQGGKGPSRPLRERVAVRIAQDLRPFPWDPSAVSESGSPPVPGPAAEGLLRAIVAECEDLGIYPTLLPAVVNEVVSAAATRGRGQRDLVWAAKKAGEQAETIRHLEDARHTVTCLDAFARALVRSFQGEADSHAALSAAYEQASKNAWPLDDFATIEMSLLEAINEAKEALRLDPTNTYRRFRIAGLQDKLVNLPSQRPSMP